MVVVHTVPKRLTWRRIMGVVIYRRVTNVYDIPLDILVETLGRGLTLNREGQVPLLEPSIGTGLKFNEEGQVVVNTGNGLTVDELGKISVDFGCAVTFDEAVDETKTTEMMVQIDSQLSLNAQKLTLKKKYQKYTIQRNKNGIVLYIIAGDVTEKDDDVIIGVPYGYGYGYGCKDHKPARENTPEYPNFYMS